MTPSTTAEEERLSRILALVDGHVKFAETKNGALLALASGALVGVLQLLYGDHPLEGWWRVYFLGLSIGLFAGAVLALLSFLPVLLRPRIQRRRKRELGGNLLFFGDTQRYNVAALFAEILEASGAPPRPANRLESMYAEQIIVNAKIASRKFTYFKLAMWSVLAGLLTPIGTLVLLLFFRDELSTLR
jgi:MFS family permease